MTVYVKTAVFHLLMRLSGDFPLSSPPPSRTSVFTVWPTPEPVYLHQQTVTWPSQSFYTTKQEQNDKNNSECPMWSNLWRSYVMYKSPSEQTIYSMFNISSSWIQRWFVNYIVLYRKSFRIIWFLTWQLFAYLRIKCIKQGLFCRSHKLTTV